MAARKYSAILYVAILIAVGATYGVYRVVDDARRSSALPMRPVVTAKYTIPLGSAIHDWALVVEPMPEQIVPDGAFTRIDSLIGRVASVDIFPGEVLVPGRLAPEGTTPGLEAKITPGKRAMALRVDDVSGLAGMVQPGSRVDVMLTLGGADTRTARMFMPNMRVLAMGSEVQRDEDGDPINATVATLEVFPAEAERLAVAMAQGRIQLVLRGYSDPDSTRTRGATTADVIAALRDAPEVPRATRPTSRPQQSQRPAEPPPVQTETVRVAPPPQRPESLTIQVFRGRDKSLTKFELDSARRDSIRRANVRRDTLPF
jgi:pilus assembly protein CpaB